MNPFDFIANLLGGGVAPQGPVQGMGDPMATTPNINPMTSAQAPSPFSNMHLPPRGAAASGTLMGTIDHLMGVPTNERIAAGNQDRVRQSDLDIMSREGQARSEIISRIGEMRAANPNMGPNQLLPMIINDPVFSRNMALVKDPHTLINSAMQSMMPTPPLPVQTAPGGRTELLDQNNPSAPGRVIQNPTAEAQLMDRVMNMTPEEQQRYAQTRQLTATPRQPTENEAAVTRMVAAGTITRQQGDQLLSGDIIAQPILNNFGQTVGHRLISRTGQQVATVPTLPGQQAPGAGGEVPPQGGTTEVPSQPPVRNQDRVPPTQLPPGQEPPASTTTPPERRGSVELPSRTRMFDSVGTVGTLTGASGSVFGQVSPDYAAPEVQVNQQNLRQLRVSLRNLREGREFARDREAIANLVPADNTFFDNPLNASSRTYVLQGWLMQTLERDRAIIADPNSSRDAKVRSEQRRNTIEDVLAAMPERSEMAAYINELANGERSGTTIADLLKTFPALSDVIRAGEASAEGRTPRAGQMGARGRLRAPTKNDDRVPPTGGDTLTPGDRLPAELPPDLSKLDGFRLSDLLKNPNLTAEQRAAVTQAIMARQEALRKQGYPR